MPVYKYQTAKGSKYYFSLLKDGKRIKRTGFKTKAEAMAAERDFILSNKSNIINEKLFFSSILDNFYKYYILHKKITTVYSSKSLINKYIISFFGDYELDKIDYILVNKWLDNLMEKEFSTNHKKKIYSILNQIFQYAVENNLISKNPCIRKSFISNNTREKVCNFWTLDEFNLFIQTFDSNNIEWKIFFDTLYYTGMRLGEIQALKWKDFDINREELVVNKSISNKAGSSKWEIIPPKTKKSNRRILLHKYLFSELLSIKGNDNDFIFGCDKPLSSSNITRTKNLHCSIAKVKQIKLHDFRHSHASLLINKGASPSIVAERLGHSDIAMTLNTYSHLFPNEQKKIINLL